MALVSKATALEALDSLDDYARMQTGVDAFGPRTALQRFIEQVPGPAPHSAAEVQALVTDLGQSQDLEAQRSRIVEMLQAYGARLG